MWQGWLLKVTLGLAAVLSATIDAEEVVGTSMTKAGKSGEPRANRSKRRGGGQDVLRG